MFNPFKSITQAIQNYLNDNPRLVKILDQHDATIAISGLPDKYNDVPYCTVINGKMVHTVGEYKAECAKSEWDHIV